MDGRADAPRDLLLGLLALQNGMVGRDGLVAAFAVWTASGGRPMADVLADQGALAPAHRGLLEALVDAHLQIHGGPERSLAALELNRSTRESLAGAGGPEVEATLAHVGSGSGSDADGDAERTTTYAVGTATGDGQRFRVLRPHARGGLGAVFVALDSELNREVALKRILEGHADDPRSRQRFLIEAEITGGLEHPGIVPVYGLGHYGDGRPYYAMRFIRGDSLKEAIERFHADGSLRGDAGRWSLALRTLLRRFTDVCNAIEYAHSRGVLHRDIKPGNVIVGKHGETLVVDWGLAKPMGRAEAGAGGEERPLTPSSASGSAETLPGAALGTPAYMSPEQARGDLATLGPRSDVYSLGATLYCLLTGRAPFDGEVGEVLREVQRGEFPPPRQLDPAIDRALEAICLKAMALEPEDRYPSCRALADDVERWAADEPVAAYREPWARTLVRWLTRHRTGVTGVAAAGLVGMVGLVAVLAVQASANVALSAANAELARSKAAVQARYDLAVDAIRTFHTGVSGDFLLEQDQFKELRDRLLRSAADFYGKLSAQLGREADVASRRALARSSYDLAELTERIGRRDDALAMHRAALAAREALATERSDPEALSDVAASLRSVASLLARAGRSDEASPLFERARDLCQAMAAANPREADLQDRLATSLLDLAQFRLRSEARREEAERLARAALAIRERLAAEHPERPESRYGQAGPLRLLGSLRYEEGRLEETIALYGRALGLAEERLARESGDLSLRAGLASDLRQLSAWYGMVGRHVEGLELARRALASWEEIVRTHPAVTWFLANLELNHAHMGTLLHTRGRPTEAEAEYRRALAICTRLVEEDPAAIGSRGRLAAVHGHLGHLLSQTGRTADAEAEYRAALEIWEKLAAENPAVTSSRWLLAQSHNNLGNLLSQTRRPAEAEAEHRAALEILRKLAAENPADTRFRSGLATSHYSIGGMMRSAGRLDEAASDYDRAIAIFQQLIEENPRLPGPRSSLVPALFQAGMVKLQAGRMRAGESDIRRAVAVREGLAADFPDDPSHAAHLWIVYYDTGLVLSNYLDPGSILPWFDRAIATCRAYLDKDAGHRIARTYLADSLRERSRTLARLGRLTEAEAELRQGLAVREPLVAEDAGNATERTNLATDLATLSDLLRRGNRTAEARDAADRAVAIVEALIEKDRDLPSYLKTLAYSLRRRGLARRDSGDLTGASEDARRALTLYDGLPSRSDEEWFETACVRAALAGLAGRPGSGVPAAEADTEADTALALLREAAALGYRGLAAYRTEDALDPLRGREDFRLLTMDLALPADPFAAARGEARAGR